MPPANCFGSRSDFIHFHRVLRLHCCVVVSVAFIVIRCIFDFSVQIDVAARLGNEIVLSFVNFGPPWVPDGFREKGVVTRIVF